MVRNTAAVPHRAVERIQAMIRNGDLRRGQPLPSQRTLSALLDVSRASLREALSILETMGTLRTEPRRGTFVADDEDHAADPERWRFARRYSPPEVYQFRFLIESHAARLAALHVTPDDIGALKENVEKFKTAVRNRDVVQGSRIDFDFHRLIMRISANRMFVAVHASYGAVVLESQRLPLLRFERMWEPVTEHENVMQAIESHDPDGAAYFMRVHIFRAASRIGIELNESVAS